MNRPTRSRFVHQVDLYLAATEATDATGSLATPLTLVKAGITCLVTDKGGARGMAYDRELEHKKIRVCFPDAIALRQGHYLKQVKTGYTRTLLVDSFRDDQDLGRLWVAECSETPDPTEGQP
jgi:hypothetical protein